MGWERAGNRFGHAGDVAQEDEPSLGRSRPSPFGDVLEEHAQVDYILVEHGEPDGLACPVRSSPGPGPRPVQERLDVVVAVELIEPGDLGVPVGEPVAQHPDRLDPAMPGRRSQRGRDVLGVADHVSSELGLGDVGGVLNRGPSRGPRVTGRVVDVALLEADLMQRRGSFPEPVSR